MKIIKQINNNKQQRTGYLTHWQQRKHTRTHTHTHAHTHRCAHTRAHSRTHTLAYTCAHKWRQAMFFMESMRRFICLSGVYRVIARLCDCAVCIVWVWQSSQHHAETATHQFTCSFLQGIICFFFVLVGVKTLDGQCADARKRARNLYIHRHAALHCACTQASTHRSKQASE